MADGGPARQTGKPGKLALCKASVCLAGLGGVLGERGILGISRGAPGLRHQPGSAPVGPALGYWVKEGVGLVVHFPLEDVAKINTP
jgi:hypothetical protein